MEPVIVALAVLSAVPLAFALGLVVIRAALDFADLMHRRPRA